MERVSYPKDLPKECKAYWKHYFSLLSVNGLWHYGKRDELIEFCFVKLNLQKQRAFLADSNTSLMQEFPVPYTSGADGKPELVLKESEHSKTYRKYLEKSDKLYKRLELDKIKYECNDASKTKMEGLLDE
jgi:hypothetical protein